MLGSLHDAEDALQDAVLRAWRGLGSFDGRSSIRSWLYRIATNASLDVIQRRPKRMLPLDLVAASDGAVSPGGPLPDPTWIEPYPDEQLGLEDGFAGPEARYERHEAVELASIAALQRLPPTQRAVLILRDVLGFSAAEVAGSLETTVASVISALQRARRSLDERRPERTQQATLRALGDRRLRELVERYMDAMGRGDVDAIVAMLAEDAVWSMPPLSTWYAGRDAVTGFLVAGPLSGRWRWRHRATSANGQPAVGAYAWDEETATFVPFALDVLTLRASTSRP